MSQTEQLKYWRERLERIQATKKAHEIHLRALEREEAEVEKIVKSLGGANASSH